VNLCRHQVPQGVELRLDLCRVESQAVGGDQGRECWKQAEQAIEGDAGRHQPQILVHVADGDAACDTPPAQAGDVQRRLGVASGSW
jgi:hypothetical protein